jgi:hypothetical protein
MVDRLEKTLQELHDSQINATVTATYDRGMRVAIGDDHRETDHADLDRITTAGGRRWSLPDAATRWLRDAARRLYPDSAFARRNPRD